jgi:copper(I)-binding protein
MLFAGMPRRMTVLFALAGLVMVSAQTARADDGLTISDAWVRMAPAAIKTHGGYFTITNHGSEARELVGAASDNYEAVELHVSRIQNGVATMERVESVEIPAGGKAEFKPGGLHLMLMGAKKPLEKDGMVPIRLIFRSGATLDVHAMVMDKGHDARGMKSMDHGEPMTH